MNLTLVVIFFCTAVNLIMFFYFKWYIKSRTSVTGALKEYRTEVNNCINEVNGCIVEINAVTDRNLLLVEEKINELKEMLDETGRRISVYTRELDRSREGEALYTNLGKGIRAALKTEVQSQNDKKLPVIAPVQAPLLPTSPMPASLVQAPPMPTSPPPAAEPKPKTVSKRQIRAQIDLLANEGIIPSEIASRLNISIAEVDLAMNLRRK